MTEKEYEGVCFFMEECWRGEFDDEKRRAYRLFLDRFTPEEVMGALHALTETGKPFLPAVPEIVAKVRELSEPPVPGWAEVWRHLERAFRVAPEESALRYLREDAHPMIAAFMQAEGYERMKHTTFYDPDYGELRIKELRDRWEEFVGVARERQRQGRALEAAGARRGIGPMKLDSVALLENLRPDSAGELPSGDPPSA